MLGDKIKSYRENKKMTQIINNKECDQKWKMQN